MKTYIKIPFIGAILFIVLLFSCVMPLRDTGSPKPYLYPGQQTIMDIDSAHAWARQHRANSVFAIETTITADLQIFDNPEKTGKPLFHSRKVIKQGIGAGTVIAQGYLISVKHLVDDTDSIEKLKKMTAGVEKDNPGKYIDAKVITEYSLIDSKGKSFLASLVAVDKNDLSLLKVKDPERFHYLPIEVSHKKFFSDESIIAIGSPLGVKNVITDGKIARRDLEKMKDGDYLYLVAPIVPGNSGGPVLTLGDMKMIGVVSMVMLEQSSLTDIALVVPNTVINKFLD
ncbi:MAG: S1C family serine protease, partial [Candidatus Parcubacteria bacterium]|nr:S1C family serine protease [Candidatus Parcubacteria bacterium]